MFIYVKGKKFAESVLRNTESFRICVIEYRSIRADNNNSGNNTLSEDSYNALKALFENVNDS